MFGHQFRPSRFKVGNVANAKRVKRAGYIQRIAAKYQPLTLTVNQQDRVRPLALNHYNSHQIAKRLGLTHSAVDEYLKGK